MYADLASEVTGPRPSFISTRYGTWERKQDKRGDLISRNIDVATCTYDRDKCVVTQVLIRRTYSEAEREPKYLVQQ